MVSMRFLSCLFLLMTFPFSGMIAQQSGSGYHIIDSLLLGGEEGWDYLIADTSAERLFISRGVRTQVVDLEQRKVIGEIPHTEGVHGVALVGPAGKGYTSNGRDSSVTVFDLKTLKTISKIKIGARNPDAIIYDAVSNRVFTMNGGSSNTTAIDPARDSVVGTLPLGGKPEFAVADGRGTIFVNIEDKSELVAFDARTLKELKRWSLAPGEEPSGLAMDTEHRILFSVCANNLMVISNADSGTVLTSFLIGSGVDGVTYDPATHCAISSNGEGTMTVVMGDGSHNFKMLETLVTRRGARTITADLKTHLIYSVAAEYGPAPAPTADRPRPRRPIVPGSVKLYTIGR